VLPERELYKSFGSTLDRFHDESEYRLPMPARYVIDEEGIISCRRSERGLNNPSGPV
jgi:peroxiredoxin